MPTPKQLLATLSERGTCSLEDLCRELDLPVARVRKTLRALWWEAEQIAGPSGWLYRLRVFHKAGMPFVARREGDE